MPVDFSQLAGSLVRALRENQQMSQQQQQLGQGQQQLEIQKQNEALNARQQKLNEELSAPTTESWAAIKAYADTLPPDQRAQLLMGFTQPSFARTQAAAGQAAKYRNDLIQTVSGAIATGKPDEVAVLGPLLGQIVNAPDDLVTLRQLGNRADQIISGSMKPPPPIGTLKVPGGYLPYTRSSSGYSYGLPSASGAPGGGPEAGGPPAIPGMEPSGMIRTPTSMETGQLDATNQVLEQIDSTMPMVASAEEEEGPEPSGLLGKIGAKMGRAGEYGSYKFLGTTTPHSAMFTNVQQVYAQAAQALMRGGSRAKAYLDQLKDHVPHPTDSPQLLAEKMGIWKQIMTRERNELMRGPFAPPAGGAAPMGGEAPNPSPSDSSSPPPGVKIKRSGGDTYYTDTEGKIHLFVPGTGWVKE